MCHVSAQGVSECMINSHYHCYYHYCFASHQLGHHPNDVPLLPPLLGAQLGICGAVVRQHIPRHGVHHLHLHPGAPAARRSCECRQRTCCFHGCPGKRCRYCRSHSGRGVEWGGGGGQHWGGDLPRKGTNPCFMRCCSAGQLHHLLRVTRTMTETLVCYLVYAYMLACNFTHSVGRFLWPRKFHYTLFVYE